MILGWIAAVAVLAVGFSANFSDNLTAANGITPGSESDRARAALETTFGLGEREQDLVVFRAADLTIDDPIFSSAIEAALAVTEDHPAVTAIASPLVPENAAQVADDRSAAFAAVTITGNPLERQDVAAELADTLSGVDSGAVDVWLTGESPLVHDVDAVAQDDLATAEIIGLPLALIVLLLAFGALVAAGLPLLLAGFGIGATFGVLGLLSYVTEFNLLTENITTLIGLGVGIDFAMFIVARFREALHHGATAEEAAQIATSTSGRSVLFSAMTTVIAMSGLFLVNSPIFWDLAVAVMVTVTVMVAAALTLLPAVLASLGARINKGQLPWRHRNDDAADGRWARVAAAVMRRPGLVLVGVGSIVLALAAPAAGLELGLNSGADAAADKPSGRGLAVLEAHFGEGAISPIEIVITPRDGAGGEVDLDDAAKLVDALQTDPDVADAQILAASPDGVYVTASSIPAPDSDEAEALLHRIRDRVVPDLALDGEVAVGGVTAGIIDQVDEMTTKLPLVIGFVLAVTFLLLLVVFRSPALAIKAIIMNLLSVGAAYGLVVLVFQHGLGESVFGFTSPGYIQSYLPLFAFVVLFGISMDYELFLLGRMREEWQRTGDNTAAVTAGMQRTAKPITSAAAIQGAVFGAFAFTSVIDVQQIGFALATAILIDATIVRALLVPASMKLMGRWNWWTPRLLERHVPDPVLTD